MTIFGMNYRAAPYEPVHGIRRAWPILVLEFRSLFRSVWGVALFACCVLPSVFKLFMLMMYVGALGFGQGRMVRQAARGIPEMDPESVAFYVNTVILPENGLFVLLLLTALATSRVVAKDRATNALEFLWTRGITPRGYFLAKWAGASLLVATVTVMAPLVVWLTGVLLADDWGFLERTIGSVPQGILGLVVFTLLLVTPCVLLSAIAPNANQATVLWCQLLPGGHGVAEMVSGILNEDVTASFGLWSAASTVARGVAGMGTPSSGYTGSLVLLAIVHGLLIWFASRRLRVEGALA